MNFYIIYYSIIYIFYFLYFLGGYDLNYIYIFDISMGNTFTELTKFSNFEEMGSEIADKKNVQNYFLLFEIQQMYYLVDIDSANGFSQSLQKKMTFEKFIEQSSSILYYFQRVFFGVNASVIAQISDIPTADVLNYFLQEFFANLYITPSLGFNQNKIINFEKLFSIKLFGDVYDIGLTQKKTFNNLDISDLNFICWCIHFFISRLHPLLVDENYLKFYSYLIYIYTFTEFLHILGLDAMAHHPGFLEKMSQEDVANIQDTINSTKEIWKLFSDYLEQLKGSKNFTGESLDARFKKLSLFSQNKVLNYFLH